MRCISRAIVAVIVATTGACAPAGTPVALPAKGSHQMRLPLVFEPNVGQLGSRDTRFAARVAGGMLQFADDGVSITRGGDRVRWRLRGGRDVEPEGVDRAAGVVNYLTDRDPHRWHTRVPTYARVRYPQVYRGIDVEYYARGDALEFDVHVAPGIDASQVRFTIDGARRVTVDAAGAVAIETADGALTWQAPVAYQEIAGARRTVDVAYLLEGGDVRFRVGSYDHAHPLVIDPVFMFATLLVGSEHDLANGIAADGSGFIYVTGSTDSLNFPNTAASDGPGGRANDAFVVKLTPDGAGLVYASFIGGTGSDEGRSIAVDAAGRAHIAGTTNGTDWPVSHAVQDVCRTDAFNQCRDAVVAELSETGDALIFSTYFGGSANEQDVAIALGPGGTIALGGVTFSADLPITSNAFDATCEADCQDAFVAVLSPGGGVLESSSYLGGTAQDSFGDLAFTGDGRLVVTGTTASMDFPVVNPLPLDGPEPAVSAAFVTVFSFGGSTLDFSTFLGRGTTGRATAIGPRGDLYVTGTGPNSPQPSSEEVFVTRIAADLRSLVFSTDFGGSGNDDPADIGVDANGNAIVVGSTDSQDFPTVTPQQASPIVTPCLIILGMVVSYCQEQGFVTAVDESGQRLLYSTYVSTDGTDRVQSVSVFPDGSALVAGNEGFDFPTTTGAFHRRSPYRHEPFVARFVPPSATGILRTFAGSGDSPAIPLGQSRQAVLQRLGAPADVDVGPNGTVYIADSTLHRTFTVDGRNLMTLHAGSGSAGYLDAFIWAAQFNGPSGIEADTSGIYIADTQNHRIRAVQAGAPFVFTIAGTGTPGFNGDGGPSIQAELNGPLAVAVRGATIVVADTGNRRIRRITADGTITTIAGTGSAGSSGDGGPAVAATLTLPTGVAFDPSGGIVIADWGANVVRRVAPDGRISTIAGTGSPGYGGDDGPATSAQLNGPYGVDVDVQGRVYVADMFNHRVRMIATDGTIHTVAGTGEPGPIASPQRAATETPLWYPAGVAVGVDHDLFITDLGNQRVARVIRIDGTVP